MSMKTFGARLKASAPYRAWKRYGDANGDLLAAGVGYFAFFSIFPALALAFTVFGFVLQGRPDLLAAIADSMNGYLPGMVRTESNPDGIISLAAPQSSTLTITGIVSVVTLLFSGLGWISAMRTGIRGVFGLDASPGSFVTAKLRDLGVLLTLGLGIAASAIMTSVVGGLAVEIAGWVALGGNAVLVTVVGLLVGVVFDTLLMVVLIRMLSGVPLPWANVRNGAVVGAVLLTAMKYFGGVLIERATANPLLGAVAVAVGLLFWLNLMSRVVLLASAWAANDVDVARLAGEEAEVHEGQDAPAAARTTAEPYAAQLAPGPPPSRAGDRVSALAGAVLGAAGALAVAAVRRARRS
ncbi:YihY/virulence factor BrkB family protein [Intrasporangium calvum]|uniref:Ribonuclease BN n=1 Tax=Intrasporangium calvum (strain ATCC 23552 / DSM 43043 / JCM 3097 / NBRC 12989 / NCIMB 10167 / NRRL B-3866 / 7 KIP) TaxID=710696 RepID=E6SEW0_INTC7|nr:YihY/virulence factor BrkB family protein [Intrasporangium calvum]ADU47717.1 ribonuclease BN [Intrasporangium calvum DSM 43043]